jgi:hypothetical protein
MRYFCSAAPMIVGSSSVLTLDMKDFRAISPSLSEAARSLRGRRDEQF